MAEQDPKEIHVGEPPTDEDRFYVHWGRDTLRNNLTFLNEVLRQLVTVNATLLAGSVLFLDENRVGPWAAKPVAAILFLSLLVSFAGIMPYESKIDIRKPAEVRDYYETAVRRKRICARAAGALLAIASGTVLIAFILH